KLITWLYKKIVGADIRELVKEELCLIQGIDYSKIQSDKPAWRAFLDEAHTLKNSTVMRYILSGIAGEQNKLTMSMAQNDLQVICGRANLTGVAFVKDEFEKLDNLWKQEHEEQKPFNPNEAI
ncbi:MAG: hypothetical protein KKF27_21575, partial [Gammaproteobacteria bacterium]|nr:hypothetical protein [Gammaproteobacteria bacterium]MBU2685840.1 hypothetical protein [Gammaproteobacteria bacterium]